MTRLRVLKLKYDPTKPIRKYGFIHYDPFEGTETIGFWKCFDEAIQFHSL